MKFEDLILGCKGCEKKDVVAAMAGSISFAELHNKWQLLAGHLIIAEPDIKILADEFVSLIRVKTLEQLLDKLLSLWKAQKGEQAKITYLCDALEKSGLGDISGHLEITLNALKALKFWWHGQVVTLKELLGDNTSSMDYETIHNEWVKSRDTQLQSSKEPLQLLKTEVTPPPSPRYYINRTFVRRTELDSNIFLSELAKEHIFLFKGMNMTDLAKLTNYSMLDESWNQLNRITVRFILLEADGHYDKICRNSKSKPVHLIQHDNGRYHWVKSSQVMEIIGKFLKNVEETFSEADMVSKIASLPASSAISIADTPGMGKSLVLANLAAKINEHNKNCIVLFIVLQEFIQQANIQDSSSSTLDVIAEYSACSQISKLVLLELLRSESRQFYLFLDGYDEIRQSRSNQIDSFLKNLQKLKNTTVIVTTRPHQKTHLEEMFGQLSYEILRFTEGNQVDFLTRFWINHEEFASVEGDILQQFSKRCLEAMSGKLSDQEKKITGIPLQCMMLAEVYAEDAKSISVLKFLPSGIVTPISFFEMYKRLCELKFRRIMREVENSMWKKILESFTTDNAMKIYMDAHVHDAIALLFPEWLSTFKPLLYERGSINETALYNIGLLEKGPNSPRSIHRTFAEYLLAEFIVKSLETHSVCVNLLFKEILGKNGTMEDEHYEHGKFTSKYYKLKHRVVAYFIEMHIEHYTLQHQPIRFMMPLPDEQSNFPKPSSPSISEDICIGIAACCSNNLEYTFDYATIVLHYFGIGDKLKKKYLRELPKIAVVQSRSTSMVEKALEFIKAEFNLHVTYYNQTEWSHEFLSIPNYTLLHLAVFMGDFNVVSYLTRFYGEEIQNHKYLLHLCVHFSAKNKEAVIKSKLLIIDMLLGVNQDWLEERDGADCTPFLQENPNLTLLQRLADRGSPINSYSSELGTVLHLVGDKNTYKDAVRWAFSKGFNEINRKNNWDATVLTKAIWRLKRVNDEVLELFFSNGADFNAVDGKKNSVLFYALEFSDSPHLITKLLEFGANVHHINRFDESALHKLLMGRGPNEFKKQVIDILFSVSNHWIQTTSVCVLHMDDEFEVLNRFEKHIRDINGYSSAIVTCNEYTYADVIHWAFNTGFKFRRVRPKDDYRVNRTARRLDLQNHT